MTKAMRFAVCALVSAAPICFSACDDSASKPVTTAAPAPPPGNDPGPGTAAGGVPAKPAK